MLDSWIIEEIKRQEQEKLERQRPVLELPLYDRDERDEEKAPTQNGGGTVITINLY